MNSSFPRSGSTLTQNILNQNPNIYASPTSGVMDAMFLLRNQFNELIENKANPNDEALRRMLRSLPEAYYEDIEKPIIVDKCRGWGSLIEMANFAFNEKVKILVCVRDLREVLSSFEKIWRNNAHLGQMSGERENYFQFQTIEGRCDFWTRNDQPVGLAYNRLKDVIARGHQDQLCFIHYEKLTRNPRETMKKVYEFLEMPYYNHNFDYVDQVTKEDDTFHGIKNLHTIRNKVESVPVSYPKILGKAADKYADLSFWKNY